MIVKYFYRILMGRKNENIQLSRRKGTEMDLLKVSKIWSTGTMERISQKWKRKSWANSLLKFPKYPESIKHKQRLKWAQL